MSEMFNTLKQYLVLNMNKTIIPIAEQSYSNTTPTIKELLDKATHNILDKKGLLPPKNIDTNTKFHEKNEECDYMIELVNKSISDAIQFEKERVELNIDKSKLKHLRYESFETCTKFMSYKQSLKDNGIDINVYKNNSEHNTIEFKLLKKYVDVFH